MSAMLTKEDVTRLLSDGSADARAATAEKVATQFARGGLSEPERRIAEDIFRALVRDAEIRVRQSLATLLKESEAVPHDVALALAKDDDSVAEPILKYSDVLTDEDLIEIVGNHGVSKQLAVAGRLKVSERVADALIDTRNEDVVATLVGNEGAEISESSMQRVLDDWADSEKIHTPLVHRSRLPIAIAERLVNVVSEQLKVHLVRAHNISEDIASRITSHSRERATLGLLGPDRGNADTEELVYQLQVNGRLTPTIVLRAACMGDMAFFEAALARLANVPLINAQILIYDAGPLGFKGLYEKADLPPAFFQACRVAVDVSKEIQLDGAPQDRERHSRQVIERILTQFQDVGAENLEYLLERLGKEEARPAA